MDEPPSTQTSPLPARGAWRAASTSRCVSRGELHFVGRLRPNQPEPPEASWSGPRESLVPTTGGAADSLSPRMILLMAAVVPLAFAQVPAPVERVATCGTPWRSGSSASRPETLESLSWVPAAAGARRRPGRREGEGRPGNRSTNHSGERRPPNSGKERRDGKTSLERLRYAVGEAHGVALSDVGAWEGEDSSGPASSIRGAGADKARRLDFSSFEREPRGRSPSVLILDAVTSELEGGEAISSTFLGASCRREPAGGPGSRRPAARARWQGSFAAATAKER